MFKFTNGWAWVRRAVALVVVQFIAAATVLVVLTLITLRLLGVK